MPELVHEQKSDGHQDYDEDWESRGGLGQSDNENHDCDDDLDDGVDMHTSVTLYALR